MPSLRLMLAQLNLTVGDLAGNQAKVLEAIRRAEAWRADLVAVPELALTGYPPEDLLLKPQFVDANLDALASIARACRTVMAVVGHVDRDRAGRLFNAAAVLAGGRRVATYHKRLLPNYGVFDEQRYFTPGQRPVVIRVGGARVGLSICEDLWQPAPVRELARAGAQVLLNLSASPYHARKVRLRQRLFSRQARTHRLAVAYCNLVGGQDELVFDGASLMLDAAGRLLARGAQFREDLVLVDLPSGDADRPPLPPETRIQPLLEGPAEIYEALTLGLRDYVEKNGFTKVVLGLSGGIDSSLTACIAADALGPRRVVGIVMPSRFSSASSQADARTLARALGLELRELSIEPVFRVFLRQLRPLLGTRPGSVPEQNLQARIRGMLLMAFSNAFGWLVLTTGDKSEMATGYTTLYGDMAGGFAVIKDVPKTLVYRLARYRNARGLVRPIPARTLRRPPSPELAPDQRAQDTLPPYPVLDRILKAYVEEDQSLRRILQRNQLDPGMVRAVVQMVDRAEYKRRQGPPGIKITPKAFGRDRRMPITNRYEQS